MADGAVNVTVIEDPTAATVSAAISAAITATSNDAALAMINLGQNIMIATVGRS